MLNGGFIWVEIFFVDYFDQYIAFIFIQYWEDNDFWILQNLSNMLDQVDGSNFFRIV